MTEKINIKNVAKLAALKLTSEEEQKLEKHLSFLPMMKLLVMHLKL